MGGGHPWAHWSNADTRFAPNDSDLVRRGGFCSRCAERVAEFLHNFLRSRECPASAPMGRFEVIEQRGGFWLIVTAEEWR